AVLGDGQNRLAGGGPGSAHHVVPFLQADATHAHGGAAHDTHVIFVKADGLSVMGGNEDVSRSVSLPHGDELVPSLQGDDPQAVVAQVAQGVHGNALDGTVPGHHHQVAVLGGEVPGVNHLGDPLVPVHLEDVDNVGAPGGAARLGNLIALLAEHPALVGEEENPVVGGGGEHGVHVVLLP